MDQVFKKERAMSAEDPKKCVYEESDGTDHAKALSHSAYGQQCRMLLKSQADCILANDRVQHTCMYVKDGVLACGFRAKRLG